MNFHGSIAMPDPCTHIVRNYVIEFVWAPRYGLSQVEVERVVSAGRLGESDPSLLMSDPF